MATPHEIIGNEWKARARELADWAMEHLVNRKDVWGQYSVLSPDEQRQLGRSYKAMTLPRKEMRGDDMVTLDKLTRHFSSQRHRKPQLIGLHAKSKEATSRWFAIDIDCHDTEGVDAEDHGRRNLNGAINWMQQLQAQGYDPLLVDSSGRGGYHLWVLLREPAPTVDVFAFVQSIAATWEENQLDEEPETFPKKVKADSIGSWFRLPGLHHTFDHYGRIWSGDEWLGDPWLEGHSAIDAMLNAVPGPPPPAAPEGALDNHTRVTRFRNSDGKVQKRASSRRRPGTGGTRGTICVDLDGVLANRDYVAPLDAIGDPMAGAVEFTRELSEFADVVVLTARLSGDRATTSTRKKIETRIRDWLDEHGFSWHDVHTGAGKPPAYAYIDDRGVSCRPEDDGPAAFSQATTLARGLCNIHKEQD